MKHVMIFAALILAALLTGCTKEEMPETAQCEESVLSVTPNISGVAVSTRAPLAAFSANSELGLFVTSGSLGVNYNGLTANANVKSTYNGGTWTQTPDVYLSPANAVIYAYYPYSSANINGTAIPIEHTSQTDYMYGTHSAGQGAVNSGNSRVNLTMRHALALLQFKFGRSNYTGNGIITRIEVANASGKICIYNRGTLNIATGAIAKTSGQTASAYIHNVAGLYTIPSSGVSGEVANLRLLLLPVKATAASGDVKMYFTIDGKIYVWDVPASTAWTAGTKNVYTVTLTGTGLIVGNVTITDWTDGMNGIAILQ